MATQALSSLITLQNWAGLLHHVIVPEDPLPHLLAAPSRDAYKQALAIISGPPLREYVQALNKCDVNINQGHFWPLGTTHVLMDPELGKPLLTISDVPKARAIVDASFSDLVAAGAWTSPDFYWQQFNFAMDLAGLGPFLRKSRSLLSSPRASQPVGKMTVKDIRLLRCRVREELGVYHVFISCRHGAFARAMTVQIGNIVIVDGRTFHPQFDVSDTELRAQVLAQNPKEKVVWKDFAHASVQVFTHFGASTKSKLPLVWETVTSSPVLSASYVDLPPGQLLEKALTRCALLRPTMLNRALGKFPFHDLLLLPTLTRLRMDLTQVCRILRLELIRFAQAAAQSGLYVDYIEQTLAPIKTIEAYTATLRKLCSSLNIAVPASISCSLLEEVLHNKAVELCVRSGLLVFQDDWLCLPVDQEALQKSIEKGMSFPTQLKRLLDSSDDLVRPLQIVTNIYRLRCTMSSMALASVVGGAKTGKSALVEACRSAGLTITELPPWNGEGELPGSYARSLNVSGPLILLLDAEDPDLAAAKRLIALARSRNVQVCLRLRAKSHNLRLQFLVCLNRVDAVLAKLVEETDSSDKSTAEPALQRACHQLIVNTRATVAGVQDSVWLTAVQAKHESRFSQKALAR